jgi:O-antigen/teichoic acid export membrane protein
MVLPLERRAYPILESVTELVATGLKGLAKHSAVYTAGDVLNRGIAFLLIPLYTAFLTPTDYGILAITATVASILGVLYLQSLETALTRFHYDLTDPEDRRRYYGTIWLLMVGFVIAASLVMELIGPSLASLVFADVPYVPYLRLVVWTTALTNSTFVLLRAALRVQERPVAFIALNIGVFLIDTAFVIYFVAVRGQGALGNLQGRFLGTLLVAVPAAVVYLRQARLQWSGDDARASLRFALPLIPHLLSLWVLNLSDRVVLQRYVSLAEVGIYSLGYQVAAIVQLFAFSAMNAWSPYFYKTAGQPGASRTLARFATYYWLVVLVLATGVSVLAKDVLAIMASRPAYHVAYRVVPWVAFGFVMRGFYFVFVTALYYTKRVKALPIVTVAAGLLNIGLNLLLVPRYGYMAAAVNTFVAYAAQAVVMYFFAQCAYSLPYEAARITKMAAVGLAIMAVSLALPPLSPWPGLAVRCVLLLTFPLWVTLLNFWTKDEKLAFAGAARRLTALPTWRRRA